MPHKHKTIFYEVEVKLQRPITVTVQLVFCDFFFGSKKKGISCRQKVEEVEKRFKTNEALSWKKMIDYTQLGATKGEG